MQFASDEYYLHTMANNADTEKRTYQGSASDAK